MAAEPIVDGIEEDLRGFAHVLRIDIATPLGRELVGRYGLDLTPTFILFDARGQIVSRLSGVAPLRGEFVDRVRALAQEG
jgi:thioredoxin-related protein